MLDPFANRQTRPMVVQVQRPGQHVTGDAYLLVKFDDGDEAVWEQTPDLLDIMEGEDTACILWCGSAGPIMRLHISNWDEDDYRARRDARRQDELRRLRIKGCAT